MSRFLRGKSTALRKAKGRQRVPTLVKAFVRVASSGWTAKRAWCSGFGGFLGFFGRRWGDDIGWVDGVTDNVKEMFWQGFGGTKPAFLYYLLRDG